MPFAEFVGCRERIARAQMHREAFVREWNAFLDDDPYDANVKVEPDGTGSIWITSRYDPLPSIFALELGEMLYQLRAALDGAVYACAIRDTGKNPPPGDRKLEFPVCETPEQFKAVGYKIEALSSSRRTIIETVQPYNAPPDLKLEFAILSLHRALRILNQWARVDRHRSLHVVGSWVSRADPMLSVPPEVDVDFLGVTPDGLLEGSHEVASFNLRGFKPGMRVKANPNLMIEVSVADGPEPCAENDTLSARINAMMILVNTVVGGLEASFLEK